MSPSYQFTFTYFPLKTDFLSVFFISFLPMTRLSYYSANGKLVF